MSGSTFGRLFCVTNFGESHAGYRLRDRRLPAGCRWRSMICNPI